MRLIAAVAGEFVVMLAETCPEDEAFMSLSTGTRYV